MFWTMYSGRYLEFSLEFVGQKEAHISFRVPIALRVQACLRKGCKPLQNLVKVISLDKIYCTLNSMIPFQGTVFFRNTVCDKFLFLFQTESTLHFW